jgi:uncharacterized membrane protein YoaK (UPF0700 family)
MEDSKMAELHSAQRPDKLRIGLLLAMNAGFVDAYTFFFNHERFASLQTGNVIQTGIYLARGQFGVAWTFLLPILFFALGAGVNYLLKTFVHSSLTWQHHSTIVQLVGIALVTIFARPLPDAWFVALLAFFMAIQADTFTKLRGMPFASVMSTGNVKTLGSNLMQYAHTHDKKALKNSGIFFGIVFFFGFGAWLSTVLTDAFSHWALLGSSVILMIVLWLLNDEK